MTLGSCYGLARTVSGGAVKGTASGGFGAGAVAGVVGAVGFGSSVEGADDAGSSEGTAVEARVVAGSDASDVAVLRLLSSVLGASAVGCVVVDFAAGGFVVDEATLVVAGALVVELLVGDCFCVVVAGGVAFLVVEVLAGVSFLVVVGLFVVGTGSVAGTSVVADSDVDSGVVVA